MKSKKKKQHDGQQLHQRAIKVRIHPTEEQEILIQKTFGCCRFYWNHALNDEQEFYAATDVHFIPTPAKYKKDFPFLSEVDSLALANDQLALEKAFSAFFDANNKAKYPRFKSKKRDRKSYSTNCQYPKGGNQTIEITTAGIRLPKLGVVAATLYRKPLEGWKLKGATISQSASGKYYCSLLFEYWSQTPKAVCSSLETTIGLDYSSPSFYVDSEGFSPEKYRWYRKAEEKLAKEQRKFSRMVRDSKNYEQQKRKIALLHERIANQRKDFAHKESRKIANSWDAVCVEDIDLRAMAGSLHLGKSTLDNGFGMFRNFLEYKLKEQGKYFVKIDKWFPSTKTCSACGVVNAEIVLGVSEWTCTCCGTHHMRDHNAAINIKNEGHNLISRITVSAA